MNSRLADILSALRMMGHEPEELVLLGAQPLMTELGTTLSTPVRRALPALVEAARIELSPMGLRRQMFDGWGRQSVRTRRAISAVEGGLGLESRRSW